MTGMVLVWYWYGTGMGLVWDWYGTGMGLVWYWYGTGMVLVWYWYGTGCLGPKITQHKTTTHTIIRFISYQPAFCTCTCPLHLPSATSLCTCLLQLPSATSRSSNLHKVLLAVRTTSPIPVLSVLSPMTVTSIRSHWLLGPPLPYLFSPP